MRKLLLTLMVLAPMAAHAQVMSSYPTQAPQASDYLVGLRPCTGTPGCPATGFSNEKVTVNALLGLAPPASAPINFTVGNSLSSYWTLAGGSTVRPQIALTGTATFGDLVAKGASSGFYVLNDADTDALSLTPGTGGDGPTFGCGPKPGVTEAYTNCTVMLHATNGASLTGMLFVKTDWNEGITGNREHLVLGNSSAPQSGPDIFFSSPDNHSVNGNLVVQNYGWLVAWASAPGLAANSSSRGVAIRPSSEGSWNGVSMPGPRIDLDGAVPAGTPLLISARSTDNSHTGAIAFLSPTANTSFTVVNTGGSTTVPAGTEILLIETGASSTFAVTAPAAPTQGQVVEVLCGMNVTAFSFVANTGQSVAGSASTCNTTTGRKFRYYQSADGSVKKWYEVN